MAIPKVNLRAETTKTRDARITFLSQEARMAIEQWLNNREEYLGIIRSATGREADRNLIFPFGYQSFKDSWIVALRKAGLLERDERTNRVTLRIHNVRKFFRTHGRWSNPDIPEALMGHQDGLKAIYNRADQAEGILIEGYKAAEKSLTIDKTQIFEAPSEECARAQSREDLRAS